MLPDDFIPRHAELNLILPDALLLPTLGHHVLLQGDELASAEALQGMPLPEHSLLIGELAGRPVQLLGWAENTRILPNLAAVELRASFAQLPLAHWLLAGRASQILTFYRTHRFCGVCGGPTLPLAHEVACECTSCQHRVWPRVSPAVMVLIRRQHQLLLARSPHFKPGVYSLIAGFVEPGESLEQCAHREVLEEVGVKIANLRWFGSQSWPFPHSLMLAFVADYVRGDICCQPGEIEDAQWFAIDALPALPFGGSLARRVLDAVQDEMLGR